MPTVTTTTPSPDTYDSLYNIAKQCCLNPWSYRTFVQCLNSPRTTIHAAYVDDKLAGYLIETIVSDETVSIDSVATLPQYRRLGCATALLTVAHHRHPNCEFWLEARASNDAAIATYKKTGYTQVGRRPHYYHHPTEDAVLFTYTPI